MKKIILLGMQIAVILFIAFGLIGIIVIITSVKVDLFGLIFYIIWIGLGAFGYLKFNRFKKKYIIKLACMTENADEKDDESINVIIQPVQQENVKRTESLNTDLIDNSRDITCKNNDTVVSVDVKDEESINAIAQPASQTIAKKTESLNIDLINNERDIKSNNNDTVDIEVEEKVEVIGILEQKSYIQDQTLIFESYVAGCFYHQDEIKKLVKNGEYNDVFSVNTDFSFSKKEIINNFQCDEKIYKYDIEEVTYFKLVADPTNEFDKNAIKVMLSFDDENYYFVGYIPKKHTKTVKEIGEAKGRAEIFLCGGKYKIAETDEDSYTGNSFNLKNYYDDYSFKIEFYNT